MTTCPRCNVTGGKSHQFELLGTFTSPSTKKPTSIFYTNPANSIERSDAPEAPLWWMAHFEATKPNHWIWIFDCHKINNGQLMSIQSAKRLMNLMYESHKNTLQGIYLIQPTWAMRTFLSILTPFVQKDVRNRLFIYSNGPIDALTRFSEAGIQGPELRKLTSLMNQHTHSQTALG
jgi:hypothetical protein